MVSGETTMINDNECEQLKGKILELVLDYIGCDGAHHKQYALDQIARTILGDGYDEFVAEYENGVWPYKFDWDVGIP